ncbi:MAG: HD domain-containing protein [Calditrichaeota bacterium]|nr:MAG: HD domain-containing protein [Calditrichota bacterium]
MSESSTRLRDLVPGQDFLGFCVVRKVEQRVTRNGKIYLLVELGDTSGRLRARWWNRPADWEKICPAGQVVKVKARAVQVEDRVELNILRLRPARAGDAVRPEDLLPASQKDVADLQHRFYQHLGSIQNPHLKALLNRIFDEPEFERRFFQAPAGKLWHHAYLYGMLEHVVCMLDLSEVLASHYPQLNLELLKCGIVLHDLGKVWEYATTRGFVDFTDEGRLIGHPVIGQNQLREWVSRQPDFPSELVLQLLHLMLSADALSGVGSPVQPMTLEAAALACLNQLDGLVNAFARIGEKDVLPGSRWSKFNNLLNRFVYVGQKAQDGPAENQ